MNIVIDEFLEKIRNFKEQFISKLEVKNLRLSIKEKKFLFCGMGGSHLAADILRVYNPELDLYIHSDYGLPTLTDLKQRLVFIISYSGNTQETISSFNEALKQKLKIIVITLNGKLLELAEKYKFPIIVLPNLNLQPRLATPLIFRAILKIINEKECLKIEKIMQNFKTNIYEYEGKKLALEIKNKIPIIYSSFRNLPLANYFKISFNETSKIPAFTNYFPEINHNEMVSFLTKPLIKNFIFIFLNDKNDYFLVRKRMKILKEWLSNLNYKVKLVNLKEDIFEKILGAITLSSFTSFYLAKLNKNNPADESLIEKFKKEVS